MLVWCYYGEKTRSPSIEDLKGAVYAGLTEEEGEWHQLLRDYGYGSFGELDEVRLDLIQKGYLTQGEVQQQIDKIDEQARAEEANRRLRKAWELYHDSFSNNEDEFVEALFQAVENSVGYISIQNLDNASEMLCTLDRDEEAESLIDTYVQYRDGELDRFDLGQMAPPIQKITDQRLRDRLNEVSEKMSREKTVGETRKRASSGSILGGVD